MTMLRPVADDDRSDFLASFGPASGTLFEGMLFDLAHDHFPGYQGGYWDKHHAPVFKWEGFKDGYRVVNANNWTDENMTAEAAALAITALALNRFSWVMADRNRSDYVKFFIDRWESVMSEIYDHPEAGKILKFLD
jgi:hypothetical protein